MSDLARNVLLVGLMCLTSASTAFAQATPVTFELSNWSIRRDTALIDGIAQTVHIASDSALSRLLGAGLGESSPRGRWLRLGKLALVDLPIVGFGHTLGHERGHILRLDSVGIAHHGIEISRWPWPVPVVNAFYRSQNPDPFDRRWLEVHSAGDEVAAVRDRAFDQAFGNPSEPWDALSASRLIYSRFEGPLVAAIDLRSAVTREEADFLGGQGRDFARSDLRSYVAAFLGARNGRFSLPELQRLSSQLRREAQWNLLDTELWASVQRVAQYFVAGESGEPARLFGASSWMLWPRAKVAITPIGIQRGGGMVVALPDGAVEFEATRTEGVDSRHRWGGSAAASVRNKQMEWRLDASLWDQESAGVGGSWGLSVLRPIASPLGKFSIAVTVGHKSEGFLPGAPNAARWLFGAGLTARPK